MTVSAVTSAKTQRKVAIRNVLGSPWLDMLVPWAQPPSPQDHERNEARERAQIEAVTDRIKHANLDALKALVAEMERLAENEDERRRGVDGRLGTIVGLSSIAATIATGIIVAQAAGTVKLASAFGRWMVALLAFYLILQLCTAIYWAIRGQSRAPYSRDKVEDLLPLDGASDEEQLRKRILALVSQLQINQALINNKVTAMAVAHQAAKNFAAGLLALSATGMLLMAWQSPESPVLEALRKDGELRELLQGPPGPMGPTGSAGQTGPVGPQGRVGQIGPAGPSCECSVVRDQKEK